MDAKTLLSSASYSRQKDGKYKSPNYYNGKRSIEKDAALKRIVKGYGYKDYQDYRKTTRTSQYRQWKKYYDKISEGTPKDFELLFGKARRGGFKARSKSLINLLRSTTFQGTGSDGQWYHGGGWTEYGWGKYH